MNIGLLSILHNKVWDFRPDLAQTYADALKEAIELHLDNNLEKQHGYFLSKKGYQKDGQTVGANFEDKLYVGNIHRIENHLYWEDEELQDDDQIINVVVVDGPITRDGGGCSYGSKDWRDQVMYANTIPQVVGHLFIINTPGGEAAARNDYEMMINDCREKGKPTVAFVDGMCCSSGVNLACRCDRVVVMNPKDEFGCIGTMAAFWAVAHDTVDQDGYRYVELVGKDCPEKNAWWRDAAKGEYEKLQADLDKDTEEFHATVRENRPLVTADMLTGKVFQAQELIPALVDEIGDMTRAIECIFALANQEMQAARFVTAPEPEGEPAETTEPEELAKLNEQQKAAINKEKGNTTVVDDGHVKVEREGFFGPYMEEVATPNNENNMTDQEKKAAEAEAAKAAAQEAAEQPQAQEQPTPAAEEAPATEEQPATEEAPATEEQPATEEEKPAEDTPTDEQPAEEQPATEEAPATDEQPATEEKPTEEQPATEEAPATEEQPAEEKPAEEPAGEPAGTGAAEEANAEIGRITEALHNSEKEVGELKKTIDSLKAAVEDKDKSIAEQKDAIDKLTKQLADKEAEIKELAGNPAPMVDAGAGVPEANGTGEAPRGYQSRIKRGMTYKEIREAIKK